MDKSYIINQDEYNDFYEGYKTVSVLPEETQRLIFYSATLRNKYNLSNTIAIYGVKDSDDKITVYFQNKCLNCGKKIYYKSFEFYCFTFYKKSKKIKFFGTDINKGSDIINAYFRFAKYDWYNNMDQNYKKLLTKTVLERIMAGKITSEESYLKNVNKVSFGGKLYCRSIKGFFEHIKDIGIFYYGIGEINLLRQIANAVDNPNAFIDRLVNKKDINKDYIRLFQDTYEQYLIFNKKICWKWSINRLNDFHLKLVRHEMQMVHEIKGTTKIEYDGQLPLPSEAKCSLIMNETDAFMEGEEQSNCVYSNYWSQLMQKRYFVLKCTYPERASIGISVVKKSIHSKNPDLAYLSQIFAKYNKPVKPETKEIFENWLKNEDVQKFFVDNFYLNIQPKKKLKKLEKSYPAEAFV